MTDADGRIITANAAFLEMAQLATEEQARDEPLDRWLGRPGVDLDVLTANLRQHGIVRLFATTMRGEYGATADVEISAVSGDERRRSPASASRSAMSAGACSAERQHRGAALPRSVEQLTELIGRVSLKDLVREATDVIERLCIEAALELTGDNRASAAEILGLSRQSLYVKLRRYGLGDLAPEERDQADDVHASVVPAPAIPPRCRPARAAQADHLVRADVGVRLRRRLVRPAGVGPLAADRCWASCSPGRWCAAPARR